MDDPEEEEEEKEDEEEEEGWSPERDVEPEKIQREILELAKGLFKDLKGENVLGDLKRKIASIGESGAALPPMPPHGVLLPVYPTFEESSKSLQKCWEETKRIAGDAPDSVKSHIFITLHCADRKSPGQAMLGQLEI